MPAKHQKITTFLTFTDQAEPAVALYTSLFPDGKTVRTTRYGEGTPMPAGTVMTIDFELAGQSYVALNGGAHLAVAIDRDRGRRDGRAVDGDHREGRAARLDERVVGVGIGVGAQLEAGAAVRQLAFEVGAVRRAAGALALLGARAVVVLAG